MAISADFLVAMDTLVRDRLHEDGPDGNPTFRGAVCPESLSVAAAAAIGPGLMEYQAAWPFTPLTVGELDDFISRWSSWFAVAAQGQLNIPGTMPERDPNGSWRRA